MKYKFALLIGLISLLTASLFIAVYVVGKNGSISVVPEKYRDAIIQFLYVDDWEGTTETYARAKLGRNQSITEKLLIYPRPKSLKSAEHNIEKLLSNGYSLRDNPVIDLKQPIDWGKNPKEDWNWHFKLNSMAMLVPFFQAYELSGDKSYLEIPYKLFDDWIKYNLIEQKRNDFRWHDMSIGVRANQLAILIANLKVESKKSAKNSLRLKNYYQAADVHIKLLSKEFLLNPGNHGLFQMMGLASLCKALPRNSACTEFAANYAQQKFKSIVESQFTSEGIHKEHSTQYHPWAIRVFEDFKELKLFPDRLFSIIEKAKKNSVWLFLPNGKSNLFGDTGQLNVANYSDLSSEMLFLASGGKSGKKPIRSIGFFPNSGYGFYRSDWNAESGDSATYLAVSAAYHSNIHKHSDDFTFEWYEGMPIIVDSGKYSYNPGPFTEYFRSTAAHNTIEIGGENYPTSSAHAYGSALKSFGFSEELLVAKMSVSRDYWKIEQERIIVLNPSSSILVLDRIDSLAPKSFEQHFHFSPEISARKGNNNRYLLKNGSSYLGSIESISSAQIDAKTYRGAEVPRVQGWISYQYLEAQSNDVYTVSGEGDKDGFWVATFIQLEKPRNEVYADIKSYLSSLCERHIITGNTLCGLEGDYDHQTHN